MRKQTAWLAVFLGVIFGIIIGAQGAKAAETLGVKEARIAASLAAKQSFSGFTERQPKITAACTVKADRAKCRVVYKGDRLRARMNARVRELADGYTVTFGHLTPIPKPRPVVWNIAPTNSWYQLTGSKLGCPPYAPMRAGQIGVAHKTLPCGSMVQLSYRGRKVTVPVIDRGPYSGSREFDLTEATKNRLGYVTDTPLRWRQVR